MTQSNGRTVVVGVDFQRVGDEAVITALRMLNDGFAHKVHLLHVLDPRDVIDDPETPALQTEEEVVERAPKILHERAMRLAAAAGLSFDGRRLVAHARIGAAVPTLLQMTIDYDADLLIVGTHGRAGIDRLVLGSVAEALVRKAYCPVLVARPTSYEGLAKTALPDAPYAPGEAPKQEAAHLDATDHVVSTQSDSWHPAGSNPTGVRIV